jgi:hypothetical protein
VAIHATSDINGPWPGGIYAISDIVGGVVATGATAIAQGDFARYYEATPDAGHHPESGRPLRMVPSPPKIASEFERDPVCMAITCGVAGATLAVRRVTLPWRPRERPTFEDGYASWGRLLNRDVEPPR